MTDSVSAVKGYNPPDPNSARSAKKYQHDKALRIAALPPDVQKLRLQIIRLKARAGGLKSRIRANRREINRVGLDLSRRRGGEEEMKSLAFAISGHQRDRDRSRKHARAVHLAYGFIRGVPYGRIEAKCYEWPRWNLVLRVIREVCGNDPYVLQKFSAWCYEPRMKEDAERAERRRRARPMRPAVMPIPPQEPPTAA